MTPQLINGHTIVDGRKKHIRCMKCRAPARFCEYTHWSGGPGVSFFYYCMKHWRTPGPYGDTPEQRASR